MGIFKLDVYLNVILDSFVDEGCLCWILFLGSCKILED